MTPGCYWILNHADRILSFIAIVIAGVVTAQILQRRGSEVGNGSQRVTRRSRPILSRRNRSANAFRARGVVRSGVHAVKTPPRLAKRDTRGSPWLKGQGYGRGPVAPLRKRLPRTRTPNVRGYRTSWF